MPQVDLFSAAAVVAVVLLLYHYIAKKYQFFLTKPVPCVKPTFLLGNSGPTIFRTIDVATYFKTLYDAFPDATVMGFYDFATPAYMLRDPEMIKKVAVKDFDHFTDHAPFSPDQDVDQDADPDTLFENSLFALRGQKWRDMRATLSPAFTGSKMRHMFELVAECGRSLVEFFKVEAAAERSMEYEMKETLSKFASDVIATVAFGIKVDSLVTFGKFLLLRFTPRLMRWLKVDFLDGRLILQAGDRG